MDQGLPFFPRFDIQTDSNSLGPRWKTWHRRFENLATALNITQSTRKRALLLHYAGEEVSDIFDTLPNTGTDYQTAVQVLNEYFIPRQNTEYEIYYFRMVKQRDNETLDQFYTRLRKAAATCDFSNVDKEIKSQIITGCTSSKLRKHALQNPTLSLLNLITFGRANELSELHNSEIERVMNRTTDVNTTHQEAALIVKQRNQFYKRRPTQGNRTTKACRYCGKNWHNNGLRDCSAQGKQCTACGKINHFASVCMSKQSNANKQDERNRKPVNTIEPREDTLVLVNRKQVSGDNGQERVTLRVLGKPISFLIDTGATVDIMNKHDYDQLQLKSNLKPTISKTYAFGSNTPINILGTMKVTLQFQTRTYDTTIHVTSDQGPTLIGKDTALGLQVIKFLHNIENEQTSLLDRYSKIFQGIGKHNKTVIKLHIDENIKPIIQKHRRIPFHLRQKVEEELQDLINKDIIECVPESEPTTWISPIVVIPKKNNKQEIRICIDMRAANTAILRERHPTPTLDDIIYDLNQAKIFSKLDLRKGYHQFELDPNSREITTFSTHTGLFRYKRLNFGISSAAEIFQNEIRKTLQGITGVLNVSDDILIYGRSQFEHDKALQDTLNRLQEFGLTLNKDKCIFNKHCLKFFGHVFSAEGIAVDQKKIEAISQINTPKTQTEVRSLLGMVNFCSRFIPRLAMITQPLRELTRKNARWMWTPRHQKAMKDIQDELTCVTNIAYFDCNKHTEIWTDASPSGLGAILLQKDINGNAQILAFASRALTTTESKYSQIERESLAVTWAIQHFRIYVFGTQFKVITDHKPLVSLFNTTNSQLSTRLERWRLKLLPYDFQVQYEPGKHNPADYLSRYVKNEKENCSALELCAENYVNFILNNSMLTAITLEEVEQHTLQDPTLQYVIHNMQQDTWTTMEEDVNEDQLKSLKKLKHELSTNKQGSILLRGARLILPTTLQQKAVDIAHQGHMGIVRTKAFIREKIWFNGLDRMIEAKLKHCIPCQAATDSNTKAPITPTALPKGPWQEVNIDHKGPLPTGEYILTIIDQYSRFPVTEIVTSTSANVNIPKIEHIFSTFGIPHIVCTDNGAPFNSQEFKELSSELGFKHRKITPCYPQANGQVERFNRTISKTLKIVDFSKSTWKKQLDHQLRIYRATPHSTTGATPAELLFGYKMQTQLPEIRSYGKPIDDESVRERNQLKKENMKEYHDSHHKQRKEEIKIGDQVLIKQKQQSKYSTPFNPIPYTVKDIKGNMITMENERHQLVRNESHVKVIPPEEEQLEYDQELITQESKEEHDPQPHQLRTRRKPPARLIQEMD